MYPYSVVCDAPGRVGGVAILSRRPIAVRRRPADVLEGEPFAISADRFRRPAARGRGAASGLAVAVQAARPDRRRSATRSAALGETALLAGDLNAVTMERRRPARSKPPPASAHVAGIGPTWLYRRLPDALRPYAGLPIDQVFAKGDIVILSAKTLEAVGSDHLPVLVEFSLLGGAAPEENAETATALNSE